MMVMISKIDVKYDQNDLKMLRIPEVIYNLYGPVSDLPVTNQFITTI